MPFLEPAVTWTDGHWERRDYPTFNAGRVVRYTHCYESWKAQPPGISASRDGVATQGVLEVSTEESLSRFQDIMARAWRQHLHLKHSDDPLPEETELSHLRERSSSLATETAERSAAEGKEPAD